MRIFWSWQSDNHQPSGRHFVRDVLGELVDELNGVEAEDAERPDSDEDDELDDSLFRVDRDTLDVAGSPPIAETILRKIREAGVFVADVTTIGKSVAGKLLPNPNVMIELGYAMRVLGHERIVLVMNQAEGATLRHLPFDLRHWRVPVVYSLRKDATDERRLEVAATLKKGLRERIVLSLRVAERSMREDQRRTHRAPDLRVVFDPLMAAKPISISQDVKSLGVKSLEDVKGETPLQPLPSTNVSAVLTLTSPPRLNSNLTSYQKPTSQWTREEVEGYNRFVVNFYKYYENYLAAQADYLRLRMRSVEIRLLVTNVGTLPATGIDVEVTFPAGIVLYNEDSSFPQAPVAPEPPPLVPFAPGHAFARLIPVDAPSLLSPSPQRFTSVCPQKRCVRFPAGELKHHHQIDLDPFMISFETPADIRSFEIVYSITANEPIDPIDGTIWCEVEFEDKDS
jgi:hypothetical protein